MENTTLVNSQETAAPAPMAQKDAVLKFAKDALATATLAEGQTLRALVTKEVRKAIRVRLYQGFKAGEIKLARQMDDSRLKKYCSSLINNWLNKDARFN